MGGPMTLSVAFGKKVCVAVLRLLSHRMFVHLAFDSLFVARGFHLVGSAWTKKKSAYRLSLFLNSCSGPLIACTTFLKLNLSTTFWDLSGYLNEKGWDFSFPCFVFLPPSCFPCPPRLFSHLALFSRERSPSALTYHCLLSYAHCPSSRHGDIARPLPLWLLLLPPPLVLSSLLLGQFGRPPI